MVISCAEKLRKVVEFITALEFLVAFSIDLKVAFSWIPYCLWNLKLINGNFARARSAHDERRKPSNWYVLVWCLMWYSNTLCMLVIIQVIDITRYAGYLILLKASLLHRLYYRSNTFSFRVSGESKGAFIVHCSCVAVSCSGRISVSAPTIVLQGSKLEVECVVLSCGR